MTKKKSTRALFCPDSYHINASSTEIGWYLWQDGASRLLRADWWNLLQSSGRAWHLVPAQMSHWFNSLPVTCFPPPDKLSLVWRPTKPASETTTKCESSRVLPPARNTCTGVTQCGADTFPKLRSHRSECSFSEWVWDILGFCFSVSSKSLYS